MTARPCWALTTWTTRAFPAQAVKLVVDGKLENYLIGREPVRDFPSRTPRPRFAGQAAHAVHWRAQGDGSDGLTDDELNRKLLGLAKDRDLKSVY